MRILLVGGSNTLNESGWVSLFRPKFKRKDLEIVNMSIGAAPSIMGVWRCLVNAPPEKGDVVIWEYAINDALHIDAKGYTDEQQIEAVERLVNFCAENEIKFTALIFQTRNRERELTLTSYRQKLHELFDSRGVAYFDVPNEYLARSPKKTRIPPRLFKNRAHYENDDRLMKIIAKGAAELVKKKATIPLPAAHPSETDITFYTEFDNGTREEFSNSVISTGVWRIDDAPMTVTMRRPGTIVGLILTSTKAGGAMDMTIGGSTVTFSVTFREKNFDKTMVKFVSLPTIFDREFAYDAGDTVAFDWSDAPGEIAADVGFLSNLGNKKLGARESRIIALVTRERV